MNSYLITFLGIVIVLAVIILGVVKFLRTVWFFRDPYRQPDIKEGVLTAPADGMVVYVRQFKDGKVVSEKLGEEIAVTEITHSEEHKEDGWMLGIYMSPLDVHFNYAPCAGDINSITHIKGRVNWPMIDVWEYVRIVYLKKLVQLFGRKFHLENERCTIFMKSGSLKLAVVLIADKFVAKITTFIEQGQNVPIAHKMAFISRGSQADLVIFDTDVEIVVEPGQHVRGGETIVAKLKG